MKIRNSYKKQDVQEEYRVEGVEYALLPAYFVNLKYETGRQLVIVNGQTGKVVGNLPTDKYVSRIYFLKRFAIVAGGILAALILKYLLGR